MTVISLHLNGVRHDIVRYENEHFSECANYCPYLIKSDPIYNTPICILFKEPLIRINSKISPSATCKKYEKFEKLEHEKKNSETKIIEDKSESLWIKGFSNFDLSTLLV